MKNQSSFEKLLIIIGAIILITGLIMFVDFSIISEFSILILLVAAQITTALLSTKIESSYPKTSSALTVISWFLAPISLYFGSTYFNILDFMIYLNPIIIGAYSIYLLKHNYKLSINILGVLWSTFFFTFVDSYFVMLSFVGILIGLLYLLLMIQFFIKNKGEHSLMSFVTTGLILMFIYYLGITITTVFGIYNEQLSLLLTSIASLIICKSYFIKSYTHYNSLFKAFLILSTIGITGYDYWDIMLYPLDGALILSIISFICVIVYLLKESIKGNNLTLVLLFIHLLIFTSNTVDFFADTSIVLIFLGVSLLTIGFIIEKNRKKGNETLNTTDK